MRTFLMRLRLCYWVSRRKSLESKHAALAAKLDHAYERIGRALIDDLNSRRILKEVRGER